MSGHERYMKISSKERKILLRKLSEENVIRKRKRKGRKQVGFPQMQKPDGIRHFCPPESLRYP